MMIKVVLDANQYVSALLKPGSKPDQVFQLAHQKKINPLLSHKILAELRRVLLYPKLTKIHQRTTQQIDNLLEKIARIAEITPGELLLEVIEDDPTDNKYLECAIEGGADFIVSGDSHLTSLTSFRGVNIVTPNIFLKLVQKRVA